MKNIEQMVDAAKQAAEKERLILPFSYDSLNLAYVLLRDQYAATKDVSEMGIPDWLQTQVDIDSPKEMGLAEANLHSFMETLISHFWDSAPVQISVTAYGRCPLHPEDEQKFTNIMEGEKVGLISKPDVALTAETIGNCSLHPEIPLYGDVSFLEYNLLDKDGKLYSNPYSIPGPIVKFQDRVKTTSQVHKLTRGIVKDKPYALDFRGARMICKDMEAYLYTSSYLLDRIQRNKTIQRIPIPEALEEYVAGDRSLETRLKHLHPEIAILEQEMPNRYESFQSLIRYMQVPIEIQIRDLFMHETAEHGLADHKKYKEKELHRLSAQYPDYDSVYNIVKRTFKGLIPSEIILSQAPFSPLAHN